MCGCSPSAMLVMAVNTNVSELVSGTTRLTSLQLNTLRNRAEPNWLTTNGTTN